MRAVLQYHCGICDDTATVNGILAQNEVMVISQKYVEYETEACVTIYINDYNMLNHLVALLNRHCEYGVKIVKVKPDPWWVRRKKS
jgi:hypothetical protein